MVEWNGWIGREQRAAGSLDPGLARRWSATFDREPPADGQLPQGIHFALCTPQTRTEALGEDGHPLRDETSAGFLPPVPLPRRMWAGSQIGFHAPITVGAQIERTSRVASITEKSGGSGSLVFVEIDHETCANGVLAVAERQTLVYREAAPVDGPLAPPEAGPTHFESSGWETHRVVTPDPRLLFRYSALTFNTHRIHYDAPYARDVERYRGLVVHGPLTASLLLQLAADIYGENALSTFTFRGLSPAIAGEPLHLVLREGGGAIELAAFAGDGRQVTKAAAERA